MSERIIYFIRHGENLANLTREFSYRLVDYSLTLKGIAQARTTAAHLARVPVAAIYSSPLKRAAETAAILAAPHHLPVTVLEDLREINVGELEGQPPSDEVWALHDGIFEEWAVGHAETAFPGGEHQRDVEQRMRRAVEVMLAATPPDDSPIVAVTHGGILAAGLGAFCPDLTLAEVINRWIANCAITEVRFAGEGTALRGELLRWGDCAHLE